MVAHSCITALAFVTMLGFHKTNHAYQMLLKYDTLLIRSANDQLMLCASNAIDAL